mgnify:CR=1 FL=1
MREILIIVFSLILFIFYGCSTTKNNVNKVKYHSLGNYYQSEEIYKALKMNLKAQSIVRNNILNNNTIAFKKNKVFFMSPCDMEIQREYSQGNFIKTSGKCDIFINGKGFLRVKMYDSYLYTRNGRLKINSRGKLITLHGFKLFPEITIPDSSNIKNVRIGYDGTVIACYKDGKNKVVAELLLCKFENVQELSLVGDGYYKTTESPSEGLPGSEGLGTIKFGGLEASNVDVAQEKIELMRLTNYYKTIASLI